MDRITTLSANRPSPAPSGDPATTARYDTGGSCGPLSRQAATPTGHILPLILARSTWVRLLHLGPRKLAALALAYPSLWTVRIGLRRLPFSRFRSLLARVSPAGLLPPLPLCWAIEALSRRLPWSSCLIQAAAGHLLLALSGTPSQLVIGVRQHGAELEAHAWLESGGRVILDPMPQGRFQKIDRIGSAHPPETLT
ncbi:lasso peptide biosynthesis B2 protein [Methylacidimicrobium sp. B4]|uniref:lasso peptide biosynthesis B2 protein n=1 Tax=Methylacidimicrobium sp. B4 TaxID=2796139 RepID=UPI001A90B7D1|nr:lasso peptide biosynthesis B2 protein [Methylacidimicrobium sp. B4]QSR85438.1 lasso peptide biosynthesis B2 protein [Methylacidimicrobium sp. B4]